MVLLTTGQSRASAINECIDACFNSASCAMNEANGSMNLGDCESGRDRCVKQCHDNIDQYEEEAPAPITGAYGAIAYDKNTGAWGMADASKSKGDAKKSALKYCAARGKDCDIVESFSNSCSAVAAGTGNRFGWAVDKDVRQAGLDAIKKCGELSGGHDHSRCFLQIYHCYSD